MKIATLSIIVNIVRYLIVVQFTLFDISAPVFGHADMSVETRAILDNFPGVQVCASDLIEILRREATQQEWWICPSEVRLLLWCRQNVVPTAFVIGQPIATTPPASTSALARAKEAINFIEFVVCLQP